MPAQQSKQLMPSTGFKVAPFTEADGRFAELAADARGEGFSFVGRLSQQWVDGTNRFDEQGACFLQLLNGHRLVAVGGINRDPYTQEAGVGRIRHVYVRPQFRRSGAGRVLLEALLVRATHFGRMRLRATDERAFQSLISRKLSIYNGLNQ